MPGHFKTRAEHAVAELKSIEAEVEKWINAELPQSDSDLRDQIRVELFNRRLNHAVQLFAAGTIADACLETQGDGT